MGIRPRRFHRRECVSAHFLVEEVGGSFPFSAVVNRDRNLEECTVKFDLKSMTRKELEKLRSDVDKAIATVTERERKAARAAAEKAVRAHGFTLTEIAEGTKPAKPKRKPAKKPKAATAPKYANPDDNSQTWSGKGRQPEWFKAALASGKNPDQLLIE